MRKLLKLLLGILIAAVVLAGAYVVYVFVDYGRIDDRQDLAIVQNTDDVLETGREMSVMTWNIGFGAYSADYSFFMDGGTESRAFSKEAVLQNTESMIQEIRGQKPDFILAQEVDTGSTRSYQVNQCQILEDAFPEKSAAFAVNYHSSYLFYPLLQPHGASNSGILTLSGAPIAQATRRSLPIETGLMKFVDLDRCYSVCRIPSANGRELCLYNLHLSAYTSDGSITTQQLEMLLSDMKGEYEAGNYVIAGGDFNKDLYGDSQKIFDCPDDESTVSQPFPTELIPDGFRLVSSLDEKNPVASCRFASAPYVEGEASVRTLDGFIVSENIKTRSCEVLDAGFAASDHNPVLLKFMLAE